MYVTDDNVQDGNDDDGDDDDGGADNSLLGHQSQSGYDRAEAVSHCCQRESQANTRLYTPASLNVG